MSGRLLASDAEADAAEMEAEFEQVERQRDSARRWLTTTVRIARLLRGRLSETEAAFQAVRHMRDEAVVELATLTGCVYLSPYFDGELSPARAEAFRVHLAGCPTCQDKLHGLIQEAVAVTRESSVVTGT